MKKKKTQKIKKFLISLIKDLNELIDLNLKKKSILSLKKDKSIVANLDLYIENFIYKKIRKSFEGHNIISEEKKIYFKKNNDFTWYIDPIDGTKGMVLGFPTWSNLIGLHNKKIPISTFANFYELKKCYLTILNENYIYEKNKFTKISQKKKNNNFNSIVFNSLHVIKNIKILNFLKKIKHPLKISGMDAYNYCLFAEGKIDVIIDFNVKKIDIFPLMKLIQNSGGKFYYLNDNKERFDFILCRNKNLGINLKKKLLSIYND